MSREKSRFMCRVVCGSMSRMTSGMTGGEKSRFMCGVVCRVWSGLGFAAILAYITKSVLVSWVV